MSSSPQAVLLAGRRTLEVFVDSSRSAPRRRVLRLEDGGARALAAAARDELAGMGFRRGGVVLALEADRFVHRRVVIPPVPGRERSGIWRRRAANLLECEAADAAYVAVPCSREGERTDEAGDAWMLFAWRRSMLRELELELRRARIPARRVVLARLALLARACELEGDETAPFLVVARERDATTLSLVRAGALIQQTVLAGGGGASDRDAAVALVQELRSLFTYWRRMSRGEELRRIVPLGFAPSFLEPLATAIHAALGGVEIARPEGGSAGAAQEEEHELELLRSCTVQGPLQAEVRVSPPRSRAVVALSLALAAAAFLAGRPLLREGETRLDRAQLRVAELESQGAELEELRRLEADHEEARGRLAADVERWTALERESIAAERLVPQVLGAFGGRAVLAGLSARVEEGRVDVELSGLASGGPDQVFTTLEALQQDLAAGEGVGQVKVLPPPRVPEDGDALAFRVTMQVERR